MNPNDKKTKFFLKELNERIVRWPINESVSNVSGPGLTVQRAKFDQVRMTRTEFDQVLKIIAEETLLVLPQIAKNDAIEAYVVIDPTDPDHLKVLLQFSGQNVPEKQSFEKLFTRLFLSEDNQVLLDLLRSDKKINFDLPAVYAEKCC